MFDYQIFKIQLVEKLLLIGFLTSYVDILSWSLVNKSVLSLMILYVHITPPRCLHDKSTKGMNRN